MCLCKMLLIDGLSGYLLALLGGCFCLWIFIAFNFARWIKDSGYCSEMKEVIMCSNSSLRNFGEQILRTLRKKPIRITLFIYSCGLRKKCKWSFLLVALNSILLLLFINEISRKGRELLFSSSYVKLMVGSILLSLLVIEGKSYLFG